MTEGAEKFMKAMSADEELRSKVEAVDLTDLDAAAEEVIAIAAEFGIELTVEDVNSASLNRELDMDEMDAIAGGSYYVSPGNNTYCSCEMSGGGSSEEPEDVGYENKQTVMTWDQVFSGGGSSSGKPNTPFGSK